MNELKEEKKLTIKDLFASNEFMKGFETGKAQKIAIEKRKVRGKTIFGWAVPNRMGGLACFTAQMPIFWNRKVARDYARERGDKKDKVVRVVIEIEKNE
jgi:hypothetical protein